MSLNPAQNKSITRRRLLAGSAISLSAMAFGAPALARERGLVEPDSTFFGTTSVPYSDTIDTASDGDLWACCWADDGALYSANGDGRGFSSNPNDFADIVVNRINGTPETGITGVRLSGGAQVGRVWTPGDYNRKPTGMVAVDGNRDGRDELYVAVQDLRTGPGDLAFNDAPAASISVSTDYGRTWRATSAPMFSNYVFTTIFFLDFGKSNGGQDHVYAYGLDRNWRDSFTNTVRDPLDLFLARVPIGSIQDRSAWRFYAGLSNGQPVWSTIDRRVAVLHDERREYPGTVSADGCSVLSQGSVVYNAPLRRYIYSSWTEHTFEFFEAPQPWGPWKLFLHKDFGPYPWWGNGAATPKNGGYGTVIPSKFISADGQRMWVQANWFVGVGAGSNNYNFSLRPVDVTPYRPSTPGNAAGPTNLARTAGTVPIDKTSHYGHVRYLNDGDARLSEDSWDGFRKDTDTWGFVWPRAYNVDRVVYTTGQVFADGGWFAGDLRVQVRRSHRWHDVTGLRTSPGYPYNATAGPNRRFTMTFDNTSGDGVRIIGRPGGGTTFTSISELEVYFDG
ncbi:DUF4185 domain-containing protein [Allokutzneria sp. A3M-2-11 16]|uniref:DUF4185 domain-containing protein n=1 Tax=Allokutzneria sp. A3M-2-11 16 TaxID=2962043 RepID=UPI0020B75E84|nr:DUF4185 domain-containing protein [Allokutzneria sp. A3M-2-11 16]MCP3804108.1 DUF4185 domain-containing protein [Allokutzneria sp. A3M-2-11 16]